MKVWLAAFTRRGAELGSRLQAGLQADGLSCQGFAAGDYARAAGLQPMGRLADWAAAAFASAQGLVFIGACGVAVRAVAPLLRGKTVDPAVVVVDERAQFVIPLLSSHLGGGNQLARQIAAHTGATLVLTTATDVNGRFAVDSWARAQRLAVLEPQRIKMVSSRILQELPVGIASEFPLPEALPEGLTTADAPVGIDLAVHFRPDRYPVTLHLAPRILYLGIGCRQGVSCAAITQAVESVFAREHLYPQAVWAVCTIDRKGGEPGLLEFCRRWGLPLLTFSSSELAALPGEFSASPFVQQTVGVDNVCERAAVAGCGGKGECLCRKTACDGVTVAVVKKQWGITFAYSNGWH